MDFEALKKTLMESIKENAEVNKNSVATALDGVLAKYLKPSDSKFSAGSEKTEDVSGKWKSFGDQAVAIYKASAGKGDIDMRLKAPTGMEEGDQTAGGWLVERDYSNQLLKDTYDTGILTQMCRKIPISRTSNGIIFKAIDETSRANGSRYGGIQAYWDDEADQMTKSKPKFRKVELKLKKLTGLCYVTDELLRDTVALDAFLRQSFAEEFGFKLDDAILSGTGGDQPKGILNSGARVTVAKEGTQDAATVVYANIVSMYTSMPIKNRANAVWFINPEVEDQLMKLTLEGQATSIPAYMPPGGLSVKPYGTLMGRPVMPIEQCSALGTEGDIIFADLSQYLLIDKGGIESASSIHLRFDYNETAFRFVLAIDGSPWRVAPITPYKGSKTMSPFVTLAVRA